MRVVRAFWECENMAAFMVEGIQGLMKEICFKVFFIKNILK